MRAGASESRTAAGESWVLRGVAYPAIPGTAVLLETSPDHVADESVVVSRDSGGAVFLKRSGQWKLVGVLFARLVFTGQIDGGDKAVFGNVTEVADVAFYRSQIEAATAPIPEIPALPVPSAAVLGGALLLLGARAARRTMRGRAAGGG